MAETEALVSTERTLEPNVLEAALTRIREARADRPFVVGQLGQSLDGRIATASGESQWINGDMALDHVHCLRAVVDAVVVGAGTIAADNPRLTVRRCHGESPARVVIDPSGRINGSGAWLAGDGARRVAVVAEDAAPQTGAACCRDDVTVIPLPRDETGALCPNAIVRALYDHGLKRLLIEGGAKTISRFIDADAMDRLHVLVAPILIGSGPRGLELTEISKLSDARRAQADVIPFTDGDVLFDCDLRHGNQRNARDGGA